MAAADAALLLIKGIDAPAKMYRPERPGAESLPRLRTNLLQRRFTRSVGPHTHHLSQFKRGAALRRTARQRPGSHERCVSPAGAGAGEISVMARLDRPGETNVLRFSSESDLTPVIDAINVE